LRLGQEDHPSGGVVKGENFVSLNPPASNRTSCMPWLTFHLALRIARMFCLNLSLWPNGWKHLSAFLRPLDRPLDRLVPQDRVRSACTPWLRPW